MTSPKSSPKTPNKKDGEPKTPKQPSFKANNFWAWAAIAGITLVLIFGSNQFLPEKEVTTLKYSGTENSFISKVESGRVETAKYEPTTGEISGTLNKEFKGTKNFRTDGPLNNLPDRELTIRKTRRCF